MTDSERPRPCPAGYRHEASYMHPMSSGTSDRYFGLLVNRGTCRCGIAVIRFSAEGKNSVTNRVAWLPEAGVELGDEHGPAERPADTIPATLVGEGKTTFYGHAHHAQAVMRRAYRADETIEAEFGGQLYRLDLINVLDNGEVDVFLVRRTKTGRDYVRGNGTYETLETLRKAAANSGNVRLMGLANRVEATVAQLEAERLGYASADEYAAAPGRESLVDTLDVERLDTADPASGDYLGEVEQGEPAVMSRAQLHTLERTGTAEPGRVISTFCAACGHKRADHKAEPALDGRAGCRAAEGLARCQCTRIANPTH